MNTTNRVIDEVHAIRRQLLAEAHGDLGVATARAHEFAKGFGLPVVQGHPRPPRVDRVQENVTPYKPAPR